jgi:hypothetical protein
MKFSIPTVLIFRVSLDANGTDGVEPRQGGFMLNHLLAEALAETADNLSRTASILEFTRDAAVDLSPEAQQRLNMVHMGLAMAMQAMNHDELIEVMEQSERYIPVWLSLT